MIKCVVPVSGGKDSQACLKFALTIYKPSEIFGLFCDTQFEHPETYKHIERMRQMYGVNILTITAGSVEEKVLKYGRFPGGGARHCTDELKIVPSKKWYKNLAETQEEGFVVFYGMRSEESAERAKRYNLKMTDELYEPHEVLAKYPKYLGKLGVRFRMPILDWTNKQVFDYLDGEHNPLYNAGFDRVGCFPCLASGDKWKEKAFAYDKFGQEQRIKVAVIEDKIGKSVFTSKGGMQRNNADQADMFSSPGCRICEI
jgi:3'-phosphoadenosine 5'-phosphosulfate sulfotransferase (PAPS reductase)/FAD synthetase